jgi:flagellar protein FliO/FliZ
VIGGVAPAAPGLAAGNLMQTIFALCLVLGLLAVLAWFMKRYGPKAAAGPAHLRIVGALNLGGRERIMVVEVGDQWIVVGAAPGRVNALATMARQAGAEADAALHPQVPPAGSFSDWLKQTIDKRNAK